MSKANILDGISSAALVTAVTPKIIKLEHDDWKQRVAINAFIATVAQHTSRTFIGGAASGAAVGGAVGGAIEGFNYLAERFNADPDFRIKRAGFMKQVVEGSQNPASRSEYTLKGLPEQLLWGTVEGAATGAVIGVGTVGLYKTRKFLADQTSR